jgi:heme exporter protein D
MIWHDANEFFSMGGHGLYVWGAYGAMAVLLAVEAVLVVLRHRAARAAAADEAAAADLEAAEAGGLPPGAAEAVRASGVRP